MRNRRERGVGGTGRGKTEKKRYLDGEMDYNRICRFQIRFVYIRLG